MRLPLLASAVAGLVALAGAAAAQTQDGIAMNAPSAPGASADYLSQAFGGPARDNTDRNQRYLIRLRSLHEWMLRLKAKDGGQLSAEHVAMLERQLDKLNRIYGKG
jgi:hypothetical protein